MGGQSAEQRLMGAVRVGGEFPAGGSGCFRGPPRTEGLGSLQTRTVSFQREARGTSTCDIPLGCTPTLPVLSSPHHLVIYKSFFHPHSLNVKGLEHPIN